MATMNSYLFFHSRHGYFAMAIHEKIRFIRQLKGWSQEDVANKLDMSTNGYGSIERGDTDVNLSRLRQIAEVFGIRLSDLVESDNKGVVNLACEQNHFNWQIDTCSQHYVLTLKSELEKSQMLLGQKEAEIAYLKEIIDLLKLQKSTENT